ncbi:MULTISPECIES: hypothetical protein [Rhodopseudomonas]|nr:MULTISPECIES: hypothetical protein [Rhodopseudomonas]MDF3811717.1 hypothetical protein [Rhodopseudomonas sp. BAL398]WOK15583.1 hypothetical protein RBJ75_15470 [Rhodopseudomonas sp. BAL398]
MDWFRINLRLGSRLALFALALQLVLSFGHFHGLDVAATAVAQAGSAMAPAQPTPDHHQDSVDLCAICVTMAMAGAAMIATPPALALPPPFALRRFAAAAGRAEPNTARNAFQPRAPPLA